LPPAEVTYHGVSGDPDIPESYTRNGDSSGGDDSGGSSARSTATGADLFALVEDASTEASWWEAVQHWLAEWSAGVPIQ